MSKPFSRKPQLISPTFRKYSGTILIGKCLRIFVISLLVLLVHGEAMSQKYLQLEKAGTLRTTRFGIGDEIVFKLRNDEQGWYTRVINNFDYKNNRLVFANSVVHIDSIEVIRLSKSKILSIAGLALQTGGANMILFSLYYSLFQDRKADWTTIASGAGNIVIGQLLRTTLAKRKFKPGKYKRLRLVDLSPPGAIDLQPYNPSQEE